MFFIIKQNEGRKAHISNQTCGSLPSQQTQSNRFSMLLGQEHADEMLKASIAKGERPQVGEKAGCEEGYQSL